MSRKRIKQYLMLLLAIGVIAVVANGAGTFASFNAEVTNGGNTFATGSLVLNNTHGTTTCTSAFGTGGSSNANGSGVDCATLFNNVTFTPLHATADGTISTSTLTVSNISGGAIYNGDKLVVTPSSGSPFTVTAANTTPLTSSGSLAIVETLASTFTGATVLDASPTSFADVTLQNAGTIDAHDIVLTPTGCTSSYGEGSGTFDATSTPAVVGQTVTTVAITGLSGTFLAGEPLVIAEGTSHVQTFIVASIAGSTVTVQGTPKWNFAYTSAATVSGPQFNGVAANNICGNIKLSVTEETTSGFPDTLFGNAISCVYGTGGTPANTSACGLTNGVVLTSTTAHTLGGTLAAGTSRYFELAVHVDGTSFDNTFQNTKTSAFSLTWHIDQ